MMLNRDWYVLVLSMLPFTELRATIPLAVAWGMYPWRAFWLAVVGNVIPVFPILLLLQPVEKGLKSFPRLGSSFQNLLRKTRYKGEQIKKYGLLGLLLFVAIPLPGTGAWTGAILAWLFGFPYFSAFFMISLGVLGAGLLVTLASLGLFQVARFYGLEIILIVLIVILLLWYWQKRK
ncbi:MAG TPA: small multi-drug export protein [Clostridia bacterium]|jgi:uncharacterized membrane protein|nr:small multi-drug export protein [Clostridia bacterium]HHY05530.1 small multi-drug export protein [Clostridia bacterium]